MKSLTAIFGTSLWYFLVFSSFALAVAALAAMIRTLREKRGKGRALVSAAGTLLAFLLFVILMDFGHYTAACLSNSYTLLQQTLFSQPWIVYLAAEILIGALLFCTEMEHRRHRRTHLTPDAIRHAVNLLPDGIAVSDRRGTVRLANLQMEALCRELTGEVLSDGNRLWARVKEKSLGPGDQIIIPAKDGRIWLFEEGAITVEGEAYRQLIARDVTARYRVTEELKAKNARLQDIQRRMRAVSDLSGDMFVAEERAKARAALHNQLGQVLLMGRHYLNHPGGTDPKLVYTLTRQMNRFLMGEAEEPAAKGQDALSQAVAMAGSIGVAVRFRGSAPGEERVRELWAQAIAECAANTVKHAEGNSLTAVFSDSEEGFFITVTNSGRPPRGPVAESGGLLSLRKKAEAAGGAMTVESAPAFALTIRLPRNAISPEEGN